MSTWLEPLCCTRRGAAHGRRGSPCQDASGWLRCQDRQGAPVQVMVVADGHGGARYLHSDVGSWLACRVALAATRQLLRAEATGPSGLPSPARQWQQLLGQELAGAIHRRWLGAVRKHWQSDPLTAGAGFSPLLYGTTLGLVVMTPHWWGQTGLGDWDLQAVRADGAQLLSEESDDGTKGEATFSLCLADAAAHFPSRTAIVNLEPDGAEFALVLSTDGIRKSCSTDSDFLALGRYLGQVPAAAGPGSPVDLDASLDRISSQGSGDDVSVAIGRWRPEAALPRRPLLAGLGAGAGPRLHPPRPRSLEQGQAGPAARRPGAGRPQADAAEAAQTPGTPGDTARIPAPPSPARWPSRSVALLAKALVCAGLAAAALALFRLPRPDQRPGASLPRLAAVQPPLEPVGRKLRDLCGAPLSIRPVLLQRLPTFRGLHQGRLADSQLLAAPGQEPLNALIALSDPSGGLSGAPAYGNLQPCPQLRQALAQLWIETKGPGLAPRPAVPASRP